MSNENTEATSNKRKHDDVTHVEAPFSNLKKSRNEAISVNLSRVKWRANSNSNSNQNGASKAQNKMEKRLQPI